jgi:hypothetical protein
MLKANKLFLILSLFVTLLLSACSTNTAPEPTVEAATGGEARKLLLTSGVEDTTNDTITLPLYQGRSGTETFWYVITEASSRDTARGRGVNWSPKLLNAVGTKAVQPGRFVGGLLELSPQGTVDFSPQRVVVPGSTGFPPAQLQPGSVGQANYTPLVRLSNGVVLNASHVANSTGVSDKVVSINYTTRRVTLKETEGFYNGKEVYYVSLDASAPDAAALEGVTYAPNLNAAPRAGSNARNSARSGLALFINGQTGVNNSERQGLTSALLGEGDPLNVLQTFPEDQDYSPLWDVHPTIWTARAVANRQNTLQDKFEDIVQLARNGSVTGPDGAAWGPGNFIVNCPAVSKE